MVVLKNKVIHLLSFIIFNDSTYERKSYDESIRAANALLHSSHNMSWMMLMIFRAAIIYEL